MRAARLAGCLAVAFTVCPLGAQTDPPRDSEITERIEVELVLIDVTVVSRKGEIVRGLTREDFKLKIDDKRTPVESLDMRCSETAVEEPEAVWIDGGNTDWMAPDEERRIVLAIDYRHLERVQRVDVLQRVRNAVARLHRPKEKLMIVALTDFLRIEQPWTNDGAVAFETLERMENDITLWEPPFDHLHDAPTFEALLELTGLLGTIEGEKIVVLFSNWPSSGFHYDELYAELANRSARARVSFYTVWTRGLTPRGTSRRLARLAVETGGRFTERTNDFGLGYARAQRDSSCRYTIGFYDSGVEPERERRIVLRVDRPRTRVFHPSRYFIRSADDERETVAEAALALPTPYASESVEVALLAVEPTGRRRWKTILAVQAVDPFDEPVQVRASVRRGNSRWVRDREQRSVPFSLAHAYRLRAGSYEIAATVSYPGEREPRAAGGRVELPALEGDGWWLVDPLVLRSLGAGRVTPEALERTALDGDPLLGRVPVLLQSFAGDGLFAATRLCRFGVAHDASDVSVSVDVSSAGNRVFDAQARLTFTSENRLQCGILDTELPALKTGRYEVTVRARPPDSEEIVKRVSFKVVPAPPRPDRVASGH